MIRFEQVSKSYSHKKVTVKALDNVDLQINDHELFGVIGESGSGKSTLLRMINTLERPSQGTVKVAGVDLMQLSEAEQRQNRKQIGMIFQQFNLLYNQTVNENIGLPLRLNKTYDQKRVQEVLDFVRLSEKGEQYPRQLSGGEKQRVGIARALITQPKILLCDEPTSALDGQNAYDIMELLRKINQTFGTTMVIVSHELTLIKQLCNRTAILEKGKVLETLAIQKEQQQLQFGTYYERVRESLG
ncbi:metal ABC transporter ATP-binding protein [Enterococcus plantarum]|uniref:Metal ABC transporter ATP-binding protein n=1 Tax=Enterococcus plantarum TaxID=1077675 RepID=A0A2W3ZR49_9ENTE|nr:ATP-binding cassette domain-containing protein [Enterococcus plantarum]MBO0421885.1 ATP-binding cassette domain-containing protein [Enterococcus plantarum]MBO0466449.1 ATP-binding cassette domain-containing protein [Enterococcus plantarum]OEG17345.1 metal ABC transporter ATP-binding protein [Enterococcus plantarum]PZL71353.1 metal ABC transporter ATP-binding protein [Enterococcus plantarum]